MILWLFACAEPSPWTHEAALAAAFDRVDMDKDGLLTTPEWGRVGWGAPEITEADPNHDGRITPVELDDYQASVDPSGSSATTPPQAATGASASKSGGHGHAWRVLGLLREEIRARDPDATVPSDEAILAADAGGLDGADARALIAELRATSLRIGLDFPDGL